MSLIHVLGQLGHDVPRDISVVGFDHGGAGSLPWPVPELTTIDGRMRQVGREAMRLLSRLQPEEQHTPLCVTVGAQLVAGETVAAPRDR